MKKGWIRHLDFYLIDYVTLALVCTGVYVWMIRESAVSPGIVREIALVVGLLHMSIAFLTDAYEGIVRRGLYREFVSVVKQAVLVNVSFNLCFLYVRRMPVDLSVTLWGMLYWILLMYSGRTMWKKYLRRRYARLRNSRQVLVVTTKKEAKKMHASLCSDTIRNFICAGIVLVDENMAGRQLDGLPIVTDKENLLEYVEKSVIDEVLLNLPENREYEWELANEFLLMGTTVHIYMQQQYENLPNKCAGNIFGYDVLTSSISRINFRQTLLKRSADILGGLIGTMLTVLIGLVIGPAIYLKSPGPIFFSQIRVGKGGRKFRLYKFRSMYPDAEERKKELMEKNEISGHMFKMKDDPRVIRGIGQFIRRTSLDEFPQFWNVLKGDMSLVGTRPPTVDEYKKYDLHHRSRLSIKPGITGMWQISGRSKIMDFEEVVRLDRKYIENYSLEMDIKILIKTILVVLTERGAE